MPKGPRPALTWTAHTKGWSLIASRMDGPTRDVKRVVVAVVECLPGWCEPAFNAAVTCVPNHQWVRFDSPEDAKRDCESLYRLEAAK